MRGVDHAVQNGKRSLLDIILVLDTVDGRGTVDAQAPHLIGCHDRVSGVEPSVSDEREEEEVGLAKLKLFVVLIHVTDTANERRLGRIETFERFDCDGSRSLSERSQNVVDRLVLVLAATGSQVEVAIQEDENVLRVLDPWQVLVLLVGAMHGEARGLMFLLLAEGERDWSLRDGVEEPVAPLCDVLLCE